MPTDDVGQLVGRLPGDLASASMALARRFAAGSTLWCWSPRWPQHAEHVAVEFVHPVIVGKRALPAVAVTDVDGLTSLRTLTEPGDVLLVVAGDATPGVDAVLRRAPAWGLETIRVGSGSRPPTGSVDHLLWFDAAGDEAAFRGEFVLAYHVLWELTHVCFEHPGLLDVPPPGPDDAGHCITCADDAALAEVVEVAGSHTSVRSAKGVAEVDTTLVDPVEKGDLVLVHAGVAISRLDCETT